jgi:Transposase DDE domain group 1
VKYIIGLARNTRLAQQADPLIQQARADFERLKTTQRVMGEVEYAAYSWDKPRRVIVKAEHLAGSSEGTPGGGDKANMRFVVTNLTGNAGHLYQEVYCARGEMENRVKEQQMGLFADRTSCHRFMANQFRVLLSAAAYVLVEHIRRVALAGTELARAQVTRIRLDLFKIGARVKESVRRIVLHLASACPFKEVFTLAAGRLLAPG